MIVTYVIKASLGQQLEARACCKLSRTNNSAFLIVLQVFLPRATRRVHIPLPSALSISHCEPLRDSLHLILPQATPLSEPLTPTPSPQVTLLEDEDGYIHLRNLSMHRANSEEDALNLLFLGDTNRTIRQVTIPAKIQARKP